MSRHRGNIWLVMFHYLEPLHQASLVCNFFVFRFNLLSVTELIRVHLSCASFQLLFNTMMQGLVRRLNDRTCDRISYFNRKCSVDSLTSLSIINESILRHPDFHDSPTKDSNSSFSSSMQKFDCISCHVSLANAEEMVRNYMVLHFIVWFRRRILSRSYIFLLLARLYREKLPMRIGFVPGVKA